MEPESVTESTQAKKDDDGVDVTLIRWMLSLTSDERLDVLQKHVEAVEAIRGKP